MLSRQFLYLLPGILAVWIFIVTGFLIRLYRARQNYARRVETTPSLTAQSREVRVDL